MSSYSEAVWLNEVRPLAGILLAIAVALIARKRNALSNTGAVAAVAVASACVAAGWSWAIILIAFFVTSTMLSSVGGQAKRIATRGVVDKEGARDAWQVLANGGPFAAAAIASILWPSHLWQILGAGAIAASTADTWSTEIGTLSKQGPRSILQWTPVPPGTSGGVTWLGICAALSGAGLIALITFLMGWPREAACAAIVGGFGGSLVDSALGSAVQVRRWCPHCDKPTEQAVHLCDTTTDIVGGIPLMDNDVVNLLSSLTGAFIGAGCLR